MDSFKAWLASADGRVALTDFINDRNSVEILVAEIWLRGYYVGVQSFYRECEGANDVEVSP